MRVQCYSLCCLVVVHPVRPACIPRSTRLYTPFDPPVYPVRPACIYPVRPACIPRSTRLYTPFDPPVYPVRPACVSTGSARPDRQPQTVGVYAERGVVYGRYLHQSIVFLGRPIVNGQQRVRFSWSSPSPWTGQWTASLMPDSTWTARQFTSTHLPLFSRIYRVDDAWLW